MGGLPKDKKGFSLVEILVVMVIMGLVIASVLSLYTNTQRTANTSEEVVDLQQNLRVALETLAADIRMAGFLVPGNTDAIQFAPAALPVADKIDDISGSNFFHLNTVSSTRTYSRIIDVANTSPLTVNVPRQMLRNFKSDDQVFIISHVSGDNIKAPTGGQSSPKVTSVVENESTDVYQLVFDQNILNITSRDIIVRKLPNEDGTVVRYWLRSGLGGANNLQLMRQDSSGTLTNDSSIVATNITGVRLTYFDGAGSATTNPNEIRSVRITISGETDETRTGSSQYSGLKSRALDTIVALRNSF